MRKASHFVRGLSRRISGKVTLDAARLRQYSPPSKRRAIGYGDSLVLRNYNMARRCELSGKGVLTGNNVSHAKNRSRRRFLPNLNNVTLVSESLGRSFSFKIAASTLRTVDHRGGLDAYLLKARDTELSPSALKVKKEVVKHAETAAA
jgi:large subunit ribosomal protein L28